MSDVASACFRGSKGSDVILLVARGLYVRCGKLVETWMALERTRGDKMLLIRPALK